MVVQNKSTVIHGRHGGHDNGNRMCWLEADAPLGSAIGMRNSGPTSTNLKFIRNA